MKGRLLTYEDVDQPKGDSLPFEFSSLSCFGYVIKVWNRKFENYNQRRSWIQIRDPKGRIVEDTPVQGLFLWSHDLDRFVRKGWYGSKTKRDLLPVTYRIIKKKFWRYTHRGS
jgi:hypothetical protein